MSEEQTPPLSERVKLNDWKEANRSKTRIPNNGTTPWSTSRNVVPQPLSADRPDFAEQDRSVWNNALISREEAGNPRLKLGYRKQRGR